MTRSRHIMSPRIPWGPEEDAIIRALFPINATRDVAKLIDRSEKGVSQRAGKLGVRKAPEYLATQAHRFNGHAPGSVATRFRKGQTPANKGLRRPGYAPGRMATTQFKKGEGCGPAARNYVPIGTEKYDCKRKNIVRKISDDPTLYPAARWAPVTRLVWEAAHGPVPDGHFVRFRAGMKTLVTAQITADKLEIVTPAQHMRSNSYHNNYSKDVALAIQAKAVLTRAINSATKATTKGDTP